MWQALFLALLPMQKELTVPFFHQRIVARLLLLAALVCSPQVALGQGLDEEAQAQAQQISADAAAAAFAQSLNARERSEWINLKTYTDDEWERAEKALAQNLAACDTGDALACKTVGDAYFSGDGVWPVPAIAFILYNQACDGGASVGCIAAGDLSESQYGGELVDSDAAEPVAAVGFFEKACNLGDLAGCDQFASALRKGGDISRSDAVLERACKAGGEDACLFLSNNLMESRQPENYARAAAILDAMCRNSVVLACQRMAWRSEGAPKHDKRLALQYQYLACGSGSYSDCVSIGNRLYRGNGVAQDRDLARVYYQHACAINEFGCELIEHLEALPRLRSACTPDDAQSCAELGRALSTGWSPEADSDTGLKWLQSSCRMGIADACADAAKIIKAHRWGPSADPAVYNEMRERGCEAGDWDVCFQIASSLEVGEFGPINVDRAAALYTRLCDAGSLEGCERANNYAAIAPGDLPAHLTEGRTARYSFETELCLTQNVIFRQKTYVQQNCPRTEKGIRSNRALRDEAPWQALLWRPKILNGKQLGVTDRVACGGTLIATGWVLTAAHCLTDDNTNIRAAGHRIRLGVFNPQLDEGISYPILRTIPHPQYDAAENFVFDIALIQYNPRAGRVGRASDAQSAKRRNAIAPAPLDPLAVGERRIVTGMPAYSYGWGWTETKHSKSSNYLQMVAMEMKSEQACTAQTKFVNGSGDAALCVGGKNGAQMCYGDSGGPLVLYGNRGAQATLIGVVSAGKKCGATGLPSQYTRVAKVKNWIDRYVKDSR